MAWSERNDRAHQGAAASSAPRREPCLRLSSLSSATASGPKPPNVSWMIAWTECPRARARSRHMAKAYMKPPTPLMVATPRQWSCVFPKPARVPASALPACALAFGSQKTASSTPRLSSFIRLHQKTNIPIPRVHRAHCSERSTADRCRRFPTACGWACAWACLRTPPDHQPVQRAMSEFAGLPTSSLATPPVAAA